MNRLAKLARLESEHDVQQARSRRQFLNEYVDELRDALIEQDELDARHFAEHGVARETPPMTPESEEVFRQMMELINEWQETQNR